MTESLIALTDACLDGKAIDHDRIDDLLAESKRDLFGLLQGANAIRQRFFGERVMVCSIIAGRLGGCDQDCRFCAQSSRHAAGAGMKARIPTDQEIFQAARQAVQSGVRRFGIVYSGRAVGDSELERLLGIIPGIRRMGLHPCASAGILSSGQAALLAEAGLDGYNHNLETSRSFFPKVVGTHSYDDRLRTVEAAREAGLAVCCGGIFGLGESDRDRVEMAIELRKLGVQTVPMNFLHPIEGTPLGNAQALEPREILRIIAIYRYILPSISLKVAGGRVLNLRDLQSWIFYAGANSIMTGNYLTTAGRSAAEDMQMLKDLGLERE